MTRLVVLIAVALVLALPLKAEQVLTVFAAASLKTALDPVNRAFTAAIGVPVRTSYAASSALARQIEQGAPADVFSAADRDWMDHLMARNAIAPGTRIDLLGNRLVVVAPKTSPLESLAFDPAGVRSALDGGRLAVAEVTAVPAGRYAKAALDRLGLWDEVKSRLAMAENVRAALAFVARGEAPLGIVYATDAVADRQVKIVATFPPETHPAIVYPFAATRGGQVETARRYLEFLRGPTARTMFEIQGFSMINRQAP